MTFTVVYQIPTDITENHRPLGQILYDESLQYWDVYTNNTVTSTPEIRINLTRLPPFLCRAGDRNALSIILVWPELPQHFNHSTYPSFVLLSLHIFSRVLSPSCLWVPAGHMSVPISGPCSRFNFSRLSPPEEWLWTVADGLREVARGRGVKPRRYL